ncbi:polysaccharide deacetylase family protein [Candidatus Saccharibacteria bacterium]|nr:polysaccharide deacetylase family protein [Candidatus Saccharibacteria bacterium]
MADGLESDAVNAVDMTEEICKNRDFFEPDIELNGEAEIYINKGEVYEDAGFTAVDFCGVAEEKTEGEVDTNTAGEYELKYVAVDPAGNQAEITRRIIVRAESRGTVYLTFDDGPGPYTADLLDVLAKYKVKATFFVTGAGDDAILKREYDEGHAIGLHSLTHDYSIIYRSVDAFWNDLNAVEERVQRVTGEASKLLRFPGGSSNTVSRRYDGGIKIMSKLTADVESKGYAYFDWNVSSGDAGQTTSTDVVYNNVTSGFREGGSIIVLQHDIKDFSVAAVEKIIKYGLENGYTFAKLDTSSYNAHHGINN